MAAKRILNLTNIPLRHAGFEEIRTNDNQRQRIERAIYPFFMAMATRQEDIYYLVNLVKQLDKRQDCRVAIPYTFTSTIRMILAKQLHREGIETYALTLDGQNCEWVDPRD
jgi:hypothetical protein